MVRVKICGVTRVQDAAAACAAGADLIGLNFYPPSPRFIELDRAVEIRAAVAGRALAVGVFVNPARETVARALERLALDALQIYADHPGDLLSGWPVPMIRPISLRDGHDEAAQSAAAVASRDLVLLDAYDPILYGGSGTALAIEHLAGFDLRRCIIAGGLRPETVAAVAALCPYGVDVASGVEAAPGIKDHDKLRSFIENAKSAG